MLPIVNITFQIWADRGSIDWRKKMRGLVGGELVPAIVAFDPADPAAVPRAEQAKVLL